MAEKIELVFGIDALFNGVMKKIWLFPKAEYLSLELCSKL